MRILAAMLLIGLASEAWAKSDKSGMLACNPNDENKKPVIYVFDGEYLLRDNDLAYPFRHIASLPQKTEMYFSYAHGATNFSHGKQMSKVFYRNGHG